MFNICCQVILGNHTLDDCGVQQDQWGLVSWERLSLEPCSEQNRSLDHFQAECGGQAECGWPRVKTVRRLAVVMWGGVCSRPGAYVLNPLVLLESPSPVFDLRLFKTVGIQQTKVQDQLASLGNSIRAIQRVLLPLSKLFQKHERREHFQTHCMRLTLPGLKLRKGHHKKRKLETNILINAEWKNSPTVIANWIPQSVKCQTQWSSGILPTGRQEVQHQQID